MRKDTGTTRSSLTSFMESVFPEPNTGCWIWAGSVRSASGHGSVFYKNLKLFTAHRASYFFHKGEIPNGQSVLHTCDVPQCVNPDHLYLGTQQQNVIDRDSRKRRRPPKGSLNGRALINEVIADGIKALLSTGISHKEIAKTYGVSKGCVSEISSKRTWI